MKINDLELYRVEVQQTDSSALHHSLLVRLTTTMGVEGWGESSVNWRVDELGPRRDALLAVLEGRSIYDIEELYTLESLRPAPLRCAVEMAVWDALGRTLRQPLCNLLGGYYRRRIPASVRLTGHQPGMAAQIARELCEQGFHTQTIASTGNPEEDIQTVAAIREIVGHRIELRFDGQNRYNMETARDLSAGMEPHDLQFLVDPLNASELHSLASLGRQTNVPLAAWRAVTDPTETLTAVRCNAAAFLIIDLDQIGGIMPARTCAAMAAAGGVIPVLGSRPSVGVATAAMLHLAAATAAFSTANELASRRLLATVLADSFDISDGMIDVPQSIGLGVTVDRTKLDTHQAY